MEGQTLIIIYRTFYGSIASESESCHRESFAHGAAKIKFECDQCGIGFETRTSLKIHKSK